MFSYYNIFSNIPRAALIIPIAANKVSDISIDFATTDPMAPILQSSTIFLIIFNGFILFKY